MLISKLATAHSWELKETFFTSGARSVIWFTANSVGLYEARRLAMSGLQLHETIACTSSQTSEPLRQRYRRTWSHSALIVTHDYIIKRFSLVAPRLSNSLAPSSHSNTDSDSQQNAAAYR